MITTDMNEKKTVLTVKETAELLAVSQLTILRAIKDGKIKAFRFSSRGRYRISLEDLEEFIVKNRR
jgi:excisionase family DNA binding protein